MFILTSASEICNDLEPIIKIVKLFIKLICWSVPILLVVLGTWNMFKATATNDEKVASEAKGKLIKRIIYGLIIFLVPFFVELIFELASGILPKDSEYEDSNSWLSCWNSIK